MLKNPTYASFIKCTIAKHNKKSKIKYKIPKKSIV